MLKKQKRQVMALIVAMFVFVGFSDSNAEQPKMEIINSSGVVYTIRHAAGQTIYDIEGVYYYLSDEYSVVAKGTVDVVPGQKAFVLYRVVDGKNSIFKIFSGNDDMPGMFR